MNTQCFSVNEPIQFIKFWINHYFRVFIIRSIMSFSLKLKLNLIWFIFCWYLLRSNIYVCSKNIFTNNKLLYTCVMTTRYYHIVYSFYRHFNCFFFRLFVLWSSVILSLHQHFALRKLIIEYDTFERAREKLINCKNTWCTVSYTQNNNKVQNYYVETEWQRKKNVKWWKNQKCFVIYGTWVIP